MDRRKALRVRPVSDRDKPLDVKKPPAPKFVRWICLSLHIILVCYCFSLGYILSFFISVTTFALAVIAFWSKTALISRRKGEIVVFIYVLSQWLFLTLAMVCLGFVPGEKDMSLMSVGKTIFGARGKMDGVPESMVERKQVIWGEEEIIVKHAPLVTQPSPTFGEGIETKQVKAVVDLQTETSTIESLYVSGNDVSIIIPVRNEEEYIVQTLGYTFENTASETLKEIIIIDDASDHPIADFLDLHLPPSRRQKIKVLRFNSKQGLIRGRIAGADLASASNIFFLDGHCRPMEGWLAPLLRHVQSNYKRLACPTIEAIYRDSWESTGTRGAKMMFQWNFEFGWYDDYTDEVPVSSGGIFLITKKWFMESGRYDDGMVEWGGENIEQSLRIWLCGGEIYVARDSVVGHIFDRPQKPNPKNALVQQVQKNQKRAALVWLDDYYKYFDKYHVAARNLSEGDHLVNRYALRYKLKCKPFQWYVDKFRNAFERKGLLDDQFIMVQSVSSFWCLATAGPQAQTDPVRAQTHVVIQPCNPRDHNQHWQIVAGNRMIYHRESRKCLDLFLSQKGSPQRDHRPILFDCDWNGVFKLKNRNQIFQFDFLHTGRVFSAFAKEAETNSGNDIFPVQFSKAFITTSTCLTVVIPYHEVWLSFFKRPMVNNAVGHAYDVFLRSCQPYPPPSTTEWDLSQSFLRVALTGAA